MRLASKILLFLIVLIHFPGTSVCAQEDKDTLREREKFSQKQIDGVNKLIEKARKTNKRVAEENAVAFEQSRLFKVIREKLGEAKVLMSRELDTATIDVEYAEVQDWHDIANLGLADSVRHRLTLANLTISKVIFHEISLQSQKRVEVLSDQREGLEATLTSIDSLIGKDIVYTPPKNEEDETSFYANTFLLLTEANQIQEESRKIISKLNELIAIMGVVIYDSENKLNMIEGLQQEIWSLKSLAQSIEVRNNEHQTLAQSYPFSFKKLGLAVEIFLRNHPNILILFVIIFLTSYLYLRMLNNNFTQNINDKVLRDGFRFLGKPFLCATFLSLVVIQFFYLRLPFVLYGLAWLICTPVLFVLIFSSIEKSKKWWYLALAVTFLFAYLDNLILEFFSGEIYLIMLLSMVITALSVYGLLRISAFEDFKYRFLKINFAVSIALQLVAFYGLFARNYNLSKRMMVAGIFILVVFLGIMYFVKGIHQIFILSREVYKKSEEESFSLNDQNLGSKLPGRLMTVGLGLGLFLFLNTFYFFQTQFKPFLDFFSAERSLGDFTFTFSSILIFFGIIYVSFLLSKIVSFLLGESYIIQEYLKKSKRKNLSNSLLLFRIGIVTTGVLVAFASTGIPIDRLTLIISALGVGIGFGLQTLVNNLVSGLIIAIEKPINVGDVIDISGKMGTMKSIGVRSSKMTTWDGSDVVVPNGDLLNQHLVNWTLSDSRARFEVEVGVAYGSDLEAVHQDLLQMLFNKPEVLNYPRPLVLFTQFGSSSIDISIKFWIMNYASGFAVKSDLIMAIDKLFKEKGYEIPFPQQDVYVKSVPETGRKDDVETGPQLSGK